MRRPGAAGPPVAVAFFLLLLLSACGVTDNDWAANTSALPDPADAQVALAVHTQVLSESVAPNLAPEVPAAAHEPVAATVAATVTVHGVTSTVASTAQIAGTVVPAEHINVTIGRPDGTTETTLLQPATDGSFTHEVLGLPAGPQSVCLNSDCHRVFVAEETHESYDVIHRRILDALVRANQIFDFETALPEWTVMVAGPSTGAGGHFDPVNKVISINGTSGRTTEEFVTTILHEVGHAIEFEHFSDADRAGYREMRGITPEGDWMPDDLLAHERWASPAEDFAEVFVVWLTHGEHQTRSLVAAQPTPEQMHAFALLAADWD